MILHAIQSNSLHSPIARVMTQQYLRMLTKTTSIYADRTRRIILCMALKTSERRMTELATLAHSWPSPV